MLTVDIVGLRALSGRFASMLDGGLVAIQLEEAEVTAKTLEEIYRRRAPRSAGTKQGGRHFFSGLTSHAQVRGTGFAIELRTDEPLLAKWIREGTKAHPIHAGMFTGGGKQRKALWWPHAAHPVLGVWHPGTKPNPWEKTAEVEAAGLVQAMGARIGARTIHGLAGHL